MRIRILAAASVLLGACAGSEPPPTLSISPNGPQNASGPVLITASPPALANEVIWSLSGPGTLSGTSGPEVTYRPPVPASASPATVTATARGQTATVVFTGQTPQQPKVVIAGLSGDVNVIYDQFDIPHIFCATDTDCFAVQGYIQAQDRLFQMDLFRRTAEGRLAQLVGAVEAGQDQQFLTLFITRDLQRIEDKLYAALPPDIKAKIDAYAAGVNAYLAFLAAHPTLMPQEYAQLPGPITPADIPAWRGQDTLAIGRLQQFQLSETIEKETGYGLFALTFGPGGAHDDAGRFGAYVLAAQPVNGFTLSGTDPDPAPAPAAVAPRPAGTSAGTAAALGSINAQMRELNALFGSIRDGSGSNNWVVDAAHSASGTPVGSATGSAMVANDPHLALQFPPLFHLAAMTSADGQFNVTGGSFPGVPGALVGRGAHVGWGVTVVGYDVTDLYQEKLTNCGVGPLPCNTVSFNGADVPLAAKTYQVKVKGEPNPRNVTVLVVPHHGPILSFDPAHQSAISMRWTGHEVTADLQAFLGLIEATSVGTDGDAPGSTTAFAALRNYATGAQNFVLADDGGHIGYDPHALVPRRDWAFTGATAGTPGHVPWFPLDGSGTAEWGSDPACSANPPAATCWVPDNQLPRGVDPAKGYFATANSDPAGFTGHANSPFGSSVDPSLYPYLSFDWDDPTDVRYARIAELLKAKTAAGKVTLKDMQDIQADHSMLLARIFETRGFYPDAAAVNQPAYTAARQLLQAWATTTPPYDCPTGLTSSDPKSAAVTDAPTLTNSAACLLFHTFLNKLLHNVFDDDFAVVSATTGQSFGGDTGAEIRALVLKLLPGQTTHSFCDDVDKNATVTTAKTCGAQVVAALATAFGTLAAANGTDTKNWLWGRVHTLTTVSPAAPLIANGFSAGPFARPGGALTVDVGNPSGSQSSPLAFAYGSGSNVRHISVMDPNTANAQVKMQLPGPERDAPFGVFSSTPDLLGQYVQNQYFDFLHGHQIDNKGVSAQGFSNK